MMFTLSCIGFWRLTVHSLSPHVVICLGIYSDKSIHDPVLSMECTLRKLTTPRPLALSTNQIGLGKFRGYFYRLRVDKIKSCLNTWCRKKNERNVYIDFNNLYYLDDVIRMSWKSENNQKYIWNLKIWINNLKKL